MPKLPSLPKHIYTANDRKMALRHMTLLEWNALPTAQVCMVMVTDNSKQRAVIIDGNKLLVFLTDQRHKPIR